MTQHNKDVADDATKTQPTQADDERVAHLLTDSAETLVDTILMGPEIERAGALFALARRLTGRKIPSGLGASNATTDEAADSEGFSATPEWAEDQIEIIDDQDNEDQRLAVFQLLAAITPSYKENKYKHEIGKRALQHLYKRMNHCRKSFDQFVAPYLDEGDDGAPLPSVERERDPFNLRARAQAIIDSNEHSDSTRVALLEALEEPNTHVEMLVDMVTTAEERKRKKRPQSDTTPAANRAASVDRDTVEREIDNAKGRLLADLETGMPSERAYLRFAIMINERVGDAHLYSGDDSPVPMEQAARTIKVANEMRNDKRYAPRTLELLNELYEPESRLDREDLVRVSDFIQHSREIDSIFTDCGELLSGTEIDCLTRTIAEEQGGGIHSARIQLLLEHLAVLAARGDIRNVAWFVSTTRQSLYKENQWACGHMTIADWIGGARANLVEIVADA